MKAVTQADGFGVEQQAVESIEDRTVRTELEVVLDDLQRWVDYCRAQNTRAPMFLVRQRLGAVRPMRRMMERDLGYMQDHARGRS